MAKKRAIVVCPGRGTYNREELGYLARHHADKVDFLAMVDAYRVAQGREPVTALDGRAKYSLAEHTRGDNASALIYACAYADFLSIDRDAYEVVAVTGNSMGWYIALACAGAATPEAALTIVDTMGALMQERLIGGQIIHPCTGEDWRPDSVRRAALLALMREIDARDGCALRLSIDLGGMLVLAGNADGLAAFESAVTPEQGRFPMRLQNHAAFHTDLQEPVAEEGRARLPAALFSDPKIPLVDGRGEVWRRWSTSPQALRAYTLGHQVVEPYDFAAAIRTSLREFAPEAVIVLGPGSTLGGAVAQSMIAADWHGMDSKAAFQARQAEAPFLLSMGIEAQRTLVTG